MGTSRRSFLKGIGGLASVVVGGMALSGCLGEGDSQQSAAPMATPEPVSQANMTAPVMAPAPSAQAANTGPVWQPSPTIAFVEGVPAVVSVRQFVDDANQDPLVITLKSGALPPGITWNPNNATIAYDGRPLGAKPDAPTVVTGIVFAADDGRN